MVLVSSDDATDARLAAAGDGEAFARLIDRYQQQVAGWLWRFTRDRQQLEELVQDVFVEVYLSLPRYRERDALGGWIRTIATRVGYRHWRRQRRDAGRAMLPLTEWDGADDGPSEQALDVQAVLDQLPPADRLVIMLRYLDDRPVAEVAALTGWSETTVKVRAFRARKKLRRLLEQTGLDRE